MGGTAIENKGDLEGAGGWQIGEVLRAYDEKLAIMEGDAEVSMVEVAVEALSEAYGTRFRARLLAGLAARAGVEPGP